MNKVWEMNVHTGVYIYIYYKERSKGNEGFYLNILITVQFRAHEQ